MQPHFSPQVENSSLPYIFAKKGGFKQLLTLLVQQQNQWTPSLSLWTHRRELTRTTGMPASPCRISASPAFHFYSWCLCQTPLERRTKWLYVYLFHIKYPGPDPYWALYWDSDLALLEAGLGDRCRISLEKLV